MISLRYLLSFWDCFPVIHVHTVKIKTMQIHAVFAMVSSLNVQPMEGWVF